LIRSLPRDLKILYGLFVLGDLVLLAAKPIIDFRPGALPYFFEFELDLGREAVFAAWFSSIQLFVVGILSLAHLCTPDPSRESTTPRGRLGWALIAAIFVLLSMDEGSQIHEGIGMSLSNRIGDTGLGGRFKDVYAWLPAFLLPALAVATYLGIFCYRQLRRRPAARVAALLGVALFGAAYLSEFVESQAFAASGETVVRLAKGWIALVEEGCEILGATCFLVAIGESLRSRFPEKEDRART
jgi:hypothetical protein